MMTASKPKIRRAGPIAGSKLVRTARNTPGDRDDGERQRHGEREHVTVVEAHQLRDRLIVRGRAEGAAEGGAIEQKLQAADDRDGDDELQQRQHADPHALDQRESSRPRWRRP